MTTAGHRIIGLWVFARLSHAYLDRLLSHDSTDSLNGVMWPPLETGSRQVSHLTNLDGRLDLAKTGVDSHR